MDQKTFWDPIRRLVEAIATSIKNNYSYQENIRNLSYTIPMGRECFHFTNQEVGLRSDCKKGTIP